MASTPTRSKKTNRSLSSLVVLGSVAVWLTLLLLPATFFDEGQSLCVSQLLLNQSCYGCGMTRAIMHLIHLDWQGAAEFNKLSFVVLPLLGFVWAREVWEHAQRLGWLGQRQF